MVAKIYQLVTGARPEERLKTLYSFLALFFLLLSYYLIKPLRNSQFLKTFDADLLPFFFLLIPVLSFAVTKVFNSFYGRIGKYRLMIWTYLIVMACMVAFTWLLPGGSKAVVVVFYFWATVYFLLALAIMWGCINTIFSSEQGERCYGFVAVGATLGNILGAELSSWIARSPFRSYSPLIAAVGMGLALLCVLQAARRHDRTEMDQPVPASLQLPPTERTFWSDFRQLLNIPYVRSIAVIVYSLALFGTALEFQSQKLIADRMAETQYLASFSQMNQALGAGSKPHPQALTFVYRLKNTAPEQRPGLIEAFLGQHHLAHLQGAFPARYQHYEEQLEARTRALFSDIYKYQGLLGIVLLMGVSRLLFAKVGLQVAALILPVFCLTVGLAFFFPVELVWVQLFLIVGGSLNYSLNNATKELLYTQTAEETKFRHKPLIEGPVMRLGDVSASIIKLLLGGLLVHGLALSETLSERIFLAVCLLVVVYWVYCAWFVGGSYDRLRQSQD